MNYLITGASGYIGKYLCNELKKRNIIFKSPSRYELDLSNYNTVCDYIRIHDIKKIVHLAAVIDTDNNSDVFESNIYMLYIVLRAAISEQIEHFTFVSTNNVYGTEYNRPIVENDPCIPHVDNSYAISKYVGELMVIDQFQRSMVKYAIARVADVYGPNQKKGELVKKIIQNIKNGVPQKIYGSGERQRDYIYVEDVSSALAYISENNLEGIYNVSTGIGTSVCKLVKYADKIAKHGIKHIEIEEDKEDKTCIILDNNKLLNKGYLHTISINEGIKKIIKNNG